MPDLDADLLGYRGHTRRAYFTDIRAWYAWCASVDLPPLQARRHHVDRWIAEQVERPQPGTGRPVAAATVARRLSCLAGLYEYAVFDVVIFTLELYVWRPGPAVLPGKPRAGSRGGVVQPA